MTDSDKNIDNLERKFNFQACCGFLCCCHEFTQNLTQQEVNQFPKRIIIPEFPMWLAIGLCITNVLFPGLGTIIAGFCVLRCGNLGHDRKQRCASFCINLEIGFMQLFLSIVLIGWLWSIVWGVLLVAISGMVKKILQTQALVMTNDVETCI